MRLTGKIFLILTVFCVSFFVFFHPHEAYGEDEQPSSPAVKKILFILSYDMTQQFTGQMVNAIKRHATSLPYHIDFNIISMNTMRENDIEQREREFNLQLRQIKTGRYDMIVTLNDDALNLVLEHASSLPEKLPLVFAGYENYTPELRKTHPNMTGVTKNFNVPATLKTALGIYPDTERIVILSDSTPQSLKYEKHLKKILPPLFPGKILTFIDSQNSMAFMLERLKALPPKTIICVMPWKEFNYDIQSREELCMKLANLPGRPFFAVADDMIGNGALGGTSCSASAHAKNTFELIEKVFANSSNAAQIPVIHEPVKNVFDYKKLEKHKIDVKLLPPDTVIINSPKPVSEIYSKQLSLLMILMLLVIASSIVYVFASKRMMRKNMMLYQTLPGRMLVVDRDENLLLVNAGMNHNFGDLSKIKKLNQLPSIDYNKISFAVKQVFESGKEITIEYGYKDIRRIISFTPLKKELFGKDAVIGFSHDNTELQQARERLDNTILSLEYASELTRSAAFTYTAKLPDVPSDMPQEKFTSFDSYLGGSWTGSKMLPELWPTENGHPLQRSKWIFQPDIAVFDSTFAELINGKTKTAAVNFRSQYFGEMKYYRIKASAEKRDGKFQIIGVLQDVTEITLNSAKLKDTLELWNVVIDSIPFLFFAKDADNDFRYLLVNKAFADFVQIDKEKAIGSFERDLFYTHMEEGELLEQDKRIIESMKEEISEYEVTTRDGKRHKLHIIRKPFVEAGGRKLILGACTDITELDSYIRNEKIINYCFETFFTDNDILNAVKKVLAAICERLGGSRSLVIQYNENPDCHETFAKYSNPNAGVFPKYLAETLNRTFAKDGKWQKKLRNGETIRLENMPDPKNGKRYSAYFAPIHVNGKIWGAFIQFFEGETYHFEAINLNLLATTAHLIELVVERNEQHEQLIDALEKARAADKAKSFFVASVSHEIRTPLNAVIGFAEMLKKNSISPETRSEYLDSIAYSGNALLQLINDVLDLSKLEAGQMDIKEEPTDIKRLIEEVAGVFSFSANEKNISLTAEKTDDIPTLKLDRLRIRQILFNLIGNAVKFTEHGKVTAKAEFIKMNIRYGTLKISVSDTGRGIAHEDIDKLMHPFVQISGIRGTNAANNGTGLGLAISKKLAEKMGGGITVQSESGRGSTFCVTLENVYRSFEKDESVPEEESANPHEPNASNIPLSELSVIAVDDVPLNLKLLEAICGTLGLKKFTTADSPREVLKRLADEHYDIVLTDMWMPDMNGAELALEIRKDPKINAIKVFALTADVEANGNFDMGNFNGIIYKPLTAKKIKDIFSNITSTL